MTAVYFVIAVLALVGAAILLWLDRRRTAVVRRERAVWGDGHGFRYTASERDDAEGLRDMRAELQRATMDIADHVEIVDLTFGRYYGEDAVVFDLVDLGTVVAIRRSTGSNVVIDVRQEKVLAPAEDDVELLGAMGRRVMFSTHLDIARRVCDRRMVALASNAPDYVEVLWNEGNWAAASMPLTNDPVRLDTALETVRRFTDLLRVLPPLLDPSRTPDPRDPSSPTGRGRRGLDEPKTEAISRDQLRPQGADPAPRGKRPPGPSPAPRPSAPQQQQQQPSQPPRQSASDSGRRMQPMPVRRRSDRPTRLDDPSS